MDISSIPPGVVTGKNLLKLFEIARESGYAIPAVNCVSSSSCNAVMEAAAKANSPVILQISQGGGQFYCGKGVTLVDKLKASAAGAVAMAYHVRAVAKFYGIPVVTHSDHCAKKLLPWFNAMLEADEEYFAKTGEPLFSSHMLDLSEESDEENIEICTKYFKRMAKVDLMLEMEIGITGGEEDGVNNEDVDPEKLYTTPQQVFSVYEALSPISPMFSIAAAFGNVHGVYKPGNVKLSPEKLGNHQAHAHKVLGGSNPKPIFLVMHGGSGSTDAEISEAVSNGVVKMNIDTDTQWAYWDGLRKFEASKRAYLQAQIGNPDGADKPNKKAYDPRVWLRAAEGSMCDRVGVSLQKLSTEGVLGAGYAGCYKNEEPVSQVLGAAAAAPTAPAPTAPTPPDNTLKFGLCVVIGSVLGVALCKSTK